MLELYLSFTRLVIFVMIMSIIGQTDHILNPMNHLGRIQHHAEKIEKMVNDLWHIYTDRDGDNKKNKRPKFISNITEASDEHNAIMQLHQRCLELARQEQQSEKRKTRKFELQTDLRECIMVMDERLHLMEATVMRNTSMYVRNN